MWIGWCLAGFFLQCLYVDSVVLPTVIWDPRRPIFACEDPQIHVKLNDQLNFLCPKHDIHSYTGDLNQAGNLPFENLYFLGTDDIAYNSCNATDCRRLLRCSNDGSSSSVFNMIFRSVMTGPDTLAFQEGKIYYLIGTGHRSQKLLDNTIGGSCNITEEKGYNRLRLQIYICTKQDIENGKCDVCQSEGCYYKDCSTSCTEWLDDRVKKEKSQCTMLQKRQCYNLLLGKREYEYQEKLWPCDKEPPIGASLIGAFSETAENDNSDSKTYQYLSIGLSITTFLLGIVSGVSAYRWHHLKNCSQKIATTQNDSIMTGVDNKNYRPSFYGGYDEPEYQPRASVIQQYF